MCFGFFVWFFFFFCLVFCVGFFLVVFFFWEILWSSVAYKKRKSRTCSSEICCHGFCVLHRCFLFPTSGICKVLFLFFRKVNGLHKVALAQMVVSVSPLMFTFSMNRLNMHWSVTECKLLAKPNTKMCIALQRPRAHLVKLMWRTWSWSTLDFSSDKL